VDEAAEVYEIALQCWIEMEDGEFWCWWPSYIEHHEELTKIYRKGIPPDKELWERSKVSICATKGTNNKVVLVIMTHGNIIPLSQAL
jgi:hypothetical protein